MNTTPNQRLPYPRNRTGSFNSKWLTGAALCCVIAASAHAQGLSVRLNDPLVDGGNVSLSVVSPNSDRVVYLADQDEDRVRELYSVPIGGGLATQLTGPLDGGRDVFPTVRMTPDGSHVVFLGDLETDGFTEIFSVPIAGGPVTKLNDPLPENGDINSFDITPDSSRVIYAGDQNIDGLIELFSVPIIGGAVTRLNDPITGSDRVLFNRVISPDSSTVIFIADNNGDQVNELYSVPTSGGVATKLNGPLVEGGDVSGTDIDISADGSTAIYVADQEVLGVEELYSVPINGGVATKISGPLVSNGNVLDFRLGPNSLLVVYRADQDTDGLAELFSVPIGGGTATKLTDSVAGGLFSYTIGAGSDRVVYQSTNDDKELFSVPIDGGAITRLNAPLTEGDAVSSFILSADASTVVYSTVPVGGVLDKAWSLKGAGPLPTALFSVPVSGGSAIRLTEPLAEGRFATNFQISNDGNLVVYRANQDDEQIFELYGVPTSGGAAVKLSAPQVTGGDIRSSVISPDSNRVIYIADQETDGTNELFSVIRGGLGRVDALFLDGFE